MLRSKVSFSVCKKINNIRENMGWFLGGLGKYARS